MTRALHGSKFLEKYLEIIIISRRVHIESYIANNMYSSKSVIYNMEYTAYHLHLFYIPSIISFAVTLVLTIISYRPSGALRWWISTKVLKFLKITNRLSSISHQIFQNVTQHVTSHCRLFN